VISVQNPLTLPWLGLEPGIRAHLVTRILMPRARHKPNWQSRWISRGARRLKRGFKFSRRENSE
jgi:hypothetical protein